jgi:hypothetical protein
MSDARDIELQKMKDKLKANQDAIAALQPESTGIQAQIRIFGTHQAGLKNFTEKQLIMSQSDTETLGAAAPAEKTASDRATNDAAEKGKAYDAARASQRG